MNIEEYISSGNLELYVAGQLPPEEAREVETMAEKYPEVRREIEEIRQAVGVFAQGYSMPASEELLRKIHFSIREEENAAVVKKIKPEKSALPGINWQWIAIAAVICFLVSAGLNLLQYQELQTTDQKVQELTMQQNVMAEQLDRTSNQLKELGAPTIEVIDLKGLEKAPDYFARVYWNRDSRQVSFQINQLFTPEENQQFQLWAIVNEQPVDLGVFDNETGILKMKSLATTGNVSAFAVTLEPKGGSVNPTLTQMYLIGQV